MILRRWYFIENSTARGTSSLSFFPLFFSLFFHLSSWLMKLQAACDYSHNYAHCTTLNLHFLSHTLSFPWFFKWWNKQQEKEPSNKAPISTLAKYWAVCLFPARLIKVSSLLFAYIYYFWRTFSSLVFVHLFPFFFLLKSWITVWFTITLGGDRQL